MADEIGNQNEAFADESQKLATEPTLMGVISTMMVANENLEKIEGQFAQVLDMMRDDQLDKQERDREAKSSGRKVRFERANNEEDDGDNGGLLAALLAGGLIAGLLGAIPGIVAGFAAGLIDWFKGFFKGTTAWLKGKWEKFTAPIKDFFEEMGKKFEELKAKFVAKLQSSKLGRFVIRVGETISNFVKTLGEIIGKLLPEKLPGGDFFKSIGNSFSKFFGFFRLIGRIFVPLTVLIDGISRSFEEFGKLTENADISDKITAGLKVITKTFLGLFTGLGDIAKSLISWAIEKIAGEDNAVSKFLDSFSFTEIMEKLVDLVLDGWNMIVDADWGKMFDDGVSLLNNAIKGLWTDVKNWFTQIADYFTEIAKNFVRAILPAKNAFVFTIPSQTIGGYEVFRERQIDLNPIPDAIYKWAGEGPKPQLQNGGLGSASSPNIAGERRAELERSSMQAYGPGAATTNVFYQTNNNNSSSNYTQNPAPSWSGFAQPSQNNRASSTRF